MSTTDLERLISGALDARADLVRPDDLRPGSLPLSDDRPGRGSTSGSVVDHRRWRRVVVSTAAAAACAAAIALPALLVDRSADRPEPGPAVPDGWIGGVGRTGPGAHLPSSRTTADIDGDGATDSVWVRSRGGRPGPVRVEVLLSSAPDQVRWTILDQDAQSAGEEAAIQLDDDPGQELVVSSEDGHTFALSVVDLVDGRLQQVPSSGSDLRSTMLPDGRTHAVQVRNDRLVSWVPHEVIGDDTEFARVDATWWVIGSVDGRPAMVVDAEAEQCVDLFGMRFGPCLAGDVPDAAVPDVSGDNPGDAVPDFLPVVSRQLDLDQDLAFTVDGSSAVARLTGPAGSPSLEVDLGGRTLTADLGPGDPVRLLDGVLPGRAGPGLLVMRESGDATAWSVWSVRGGDLVRLTVSDEAPLGSGFVETAHGLQSYRTELSRSGLLWTAVGVGTDEPEVREVWTWSLDEGPGVTATGLSCFRFPSDGSDPVLSAC